MYDAVYLFAKGLDGFLENDELNSVSIDCLNPEQEKFEDGKSLVDFIKNVSPVFRIGLNPVNRHSVMIPFTDQNKRSDGSD